jgi:hypothetical protein
MSLPDKGEKNFSLHFKCYNLTIRAVEVFETFCTCSPSSLGQDLTINSAKKIIKKSIWASLGVKVNKPKTKESPIT